MRFLSLALLFAVIALLIAGCFLALGFGVHWKYVFLLLIPASLILCIEAGLRWMDYWWVGDVVEERPPHIFTR